MKKDTPIEKLAIMVQNGFKEMDRRFDEMLTKKEFYVFKEKTEVSLYELKSDIGDVKGRLTKVETRLDSIEDILKPTVSQVRDHEKRITKLELKQA